MRASTTARQPPHAALGGGSARGYRRALALISRGDRFMGFLLSGFTVKHNVRVQNAIARANSAISLAFNEMAQIKRTNQATPTYIKWFGASDARRIERVFQMMSMLNYAANSSFIRYNRSLGRAGTYAAAQRPAVSGWGDKSIKQMLDSGEFTMKIDDAFYAQGTSEEETVQTIVHELSHLVANTDDVDCPWDTSEECYGRPNCRRLAANYPDDAIRNADSVGYYVIAVASPPVAQTDETVSLDGLFS
jgi:hypothetical protein